MQNDQSIQNELESLEQEEYIENDIIKGDHIVSKSQVIIENVIPDYLLELIRKRISDIPEDQWERGQVGDAKGGKVYEEVRRCDVAWLNELDWLCGIFTHYFNIANSSCWQYDVTKFDSIQVTRYRKGNYYDWHADYGSSFDSSLTRKISASMIISDPSDYTGGKLQVMDYHGKISSCEKKRGNIIFFDSRTPHRVTPVLDGERISLVAWMLGPKLR
jgi:PKHD-type hydroxylase